MDTHEVLREYFIPLRNQFLTLCSAPKSYPVVTWLEYSGACSKWKAFDKYLSTQDVDRLFIAVNYEETDLDNNDDNSLCRYEFSELAARIGRERYFLKGLTTTIAAGTRRFIQEHLIPNSCERMDWQEFRNKRLWTLEVDDLFKANQAGIAALYKFTKNGNPSKESKGKEWNQLTMEDACFLIESAGFSGQEHEKNVGLAYALSKITIIDDMEDFEKYNNMRKVEFYEFLGRIAELLFPGELPLSKKIGRLLTILLKNCTEHRIIFPDADADVETDSDYADDVVEEIKLELLGENNGRK